jgi:hypothetical protein
MAASAAAATLPLLAGSGQRRHTKELDMTLHTASTIARDRKPARKLLAATTSATLIALAAVTIATWRATDRAGAPATTAAAPQPAPARSLPADQPLTVYLVNSDEEAMFVRTLVTTTGGEGAAQPFPLRDADVAVVRSQEEGTRALDGIAMINAIRHGAGLLPITVVDLRTH